VNHNLYLNKKIMEVEMKMREKKLVIRDIIK
jgi:hypothetical protein